jgi:hypothetical protein
MPARIVTGRRRVSAALLLLSLGLGAAGCGSAASVSGKVSYKGAPVKGGTVTFYNASNWTGTSPIGADGSYKIDKVPSGTVKITVETKSAKPNPMASRMPKPPKDAPVPPGSMYEGGGDPDRYVAIPDKYADKEQSGLTYDVKSGSQEHPIELQ